MGERFERHRQPWRQDEIQKLHTLAAKGMALKAIAKALTRSEESVKDRAKLDRISQHHSIDLAQRPGRAPARRQRVDQPVRNQHLAWPS